MSRPFLEQSVSLDQRYGTSFGESYAVINTKTASGDSYGKLSHPYPVLTYSLSFTNSDYDFVQSEILTLFHKSHGTLGGFRLKHHLDYSTNNYKDLPTVSDQELIATANPREYQLIRWYGTQGDLTQSRRRIRKPVVGSVIVGINGRQITAFTVSNITGLVTLSENKTGAISAITLGAATVIDFGIAHTFVTGDSVNFSGVGGTVQLDGLRAEIIAADANTITVNINSTGFTAFTSGGDVNTLPQAGETVTAGCYFDIPMCFESDLSGVNLNSYKIASLSVKLIEILNP